MIRYSLYFFGSVFYFYTYAMLAGMAAGHKAIGVALFCILLAMVAILPALSLYRPKLAAWVAVGPLLFIFVWLGAIMVELMRPPHNTTDNYAVALVLWVPAVFMTIAVVRTLRSNDVPQPWKQEWLRVLLAAIPTGTTLAYLVWLFRNRL